ncbi:PH domain-containing protein [Halomarina pelagica]|uniref:PH domain-containing protein n=1 Tax=Halomarina pelagica TaxID=2961599 RepID=UPI0020C4D21C|nr:PH domain-containing protein [Halomarina sp. BND7]
MSSARDVPDWVALGPNERVVWNDHPSLYPAAASLAAGIVLFLLGPLSLALLPEPWSLIGVVLLLAGLAVALGTYLRHRSTQYVITSNEVYEKRGFLSRQVTSLRMDRVQNTTYEQSLLQRLLSYGDVHVDTAGSGGTEIVFRDVTDPQEVSRLISRQLDAQASGSRAADRDRSQSRGRGRGRGRGRNRDRDRSQEQGGGGGGSDSP